MKCSRYASLIHFAYTSMRLMAATSRWSRTWAKTRRRAFACLTQADSIVVDPHKHGLQPYGCGCILFRDPTVGRFYQTRLALHLFQFGTDLHLGEISLECSRAGASAVALWATQQLLPLIKEGEFARGLDSGREAAMLMHEKISRGPPLALPFRARARHPGVGGARR